jgi:hypothetical protein
MSESVFVEERADGEERRKEGGRRQGMSQEDLARVSGATEPDRVESYGGS